MLGGEHRLAALEMGADVTVSEVAEQRAQVGHRELPVAADVDPAQQRRIGRHTVSLERPSCPVGAGTTTGARPRGAGCAKQCPFGGGRINLCTQL
ncbi:hypothetical protein Shyhy01_06280 [Streptomyces hygroscopicus subsp. hygroscopicus]|nr:hypothetical protein Shyhy01_06280 [Streptomyces hygroscopicus subsp. hygroscopicus]